MDKLFSERYGYTKPREAMQIEEMDRGLRNGLWNEFKPLLTLFYTSGVFDEYAVPIWADFFKLSLDELPENRNSSNPFHYDVDFVANFIKECFLKQEWFEVYNLIEFSLNMGLYDTDEYDDNEVFEYQEDEIIQNLNKILERENAGYRIIDRKVVSITNEIEIQSIEEVINYSEKSSLNSVNIHLKTALSMLSDRKNPDYRNSIKESISAVESIVNIINDSKGETLGAAIKKLKTKINIHSSLEQAFGKIYGYTSDESGVRHPIKDADVCDFDDAKYMLVSCSAFVNYLIGKANKAGFLVN